MQVNKNGEEKDKNKLLIILLLLISLIAVSVTAWAVWYRNDKPVLAPDYAPQQIEQNAEPIGDEADDKPEAPQGGGAVSLIYSKEVQINLSDNNACLLFGNPGKSNHDMVVQLVIKDTVILQSGLLKPGNQVKMLELFEDARKQLVVGGYDGKLIVLYYNRESGEKAVLNTEIPVTVTVAE